MIYLFFIQYKPNIPLNSNFDDLSLPYPTQTKYSFEFQLLMIYLFFIQYKPNIQLNSNFDDL